MGAEERGREQDRIRLRLMIVFTGSARRRALPREVPVRKRELRVHTLKAVLEDVGKERVVGQEAETIMELHKQKVGSTEDHKA